MATVSPLDNPEADPRVKAVFDDIRHARWIQKRHHHLDECVVVRRRRVCRGQRVIIAPFERPVVPEV